MRISAGRDDYRSPEVAMISVSCPHCSLAFTPDGRYLVLGNFNGTDYILRLEP
jgi:hypothetical protein